MSIQTQVQILMQSRQKHGDNNVYTNIHVDIVTDIDADMNTDVRATNVYTCTYSGMTGG